MVFHPFWYFSLLKTSYFPTRCQHKKDKTHRHVIFLTSCAQSPDVMRLCWKRDSLPSDCPRLDIFFFELEVIKRLFCFLPILTQKAKKLEGRKIFSMCTATQIYTLVSEKHKKGKVIAVQQKRNYRYWKCKSFFQTTLLYFKKNDYLYFISMCTLFRLRHPQWEPPFCCLLHFLH